MVYWFMLGIFGLLLTIVVCCVAMLPIDCLFRAVVRIKIRHFISFFFSQFVCFACATITIRLLFMFILLSNRQLENEVTEAGEGKQGKNIRAFNGKCAECVWRHRVVWCRSQRQRIDSHRIHWVRKKEKSCSNQIGSESTMKGNGGSARNHSYAFQFSHQTVKRVQIHNFRASIGLFD